MSKKSMKKRLVKMIEQAGQAEFLAHVAAALRVSGHKIETSVEMLRLADDIDPLKG